MLCPSALDYSNAIQNPHLNFLDVDLKVGQPALTPLGLPRPISGNFATVFQMHCGQRDWAVRCFTRELNDQQARYAVISHHLDLTHLPYRVQFYFIPKGIKVNGQWYPILKMEWIEGELLDRFIARHLYHTKILRQLAYRWVQMVKHLESVHIAHGDLQHGNILILNGRIKLVDYDAMFIPALGGQKSREMGHPNYQHPARTANDFNDSIDRFSAWVIYVSIVILILYPDLWDLMNAGNEFILLTQEDFVQPETSFLFTFLLSHKDIRLQWLAKILKQILKLKLSQIPPLAPFTHQFEPLLDLQLSQLQVLKKHIDLQLQDELFAPLFSVEKKMVVMDNVHPQRKTIETTLPNPKPTSLIQNASPTVPDQNSLIESIQWFQEAARQGYAEAQYTLGWMYAQGQGIPQDLNRAARLFHQAAKKGYAEAQYQLGWMYAQGQGVSQDETQAAQWYIKAAKQGHTTAQQAQIQLYLKAAQQGDASAQYGLWFLHTQGESEIPHPFHWLYKSALQGDVKAQYTLAGLYERGEEVPQDGVKARQWYGKAAWRGHWVATKRWIRLWILHYQNSVRLIFLGLITFIIIILIIVLTLLVNKIPLSRLILL